VKHSTSSSLITMFFMGVLACLLTACSSQTTSPGDTVPPSLKDATPSSTTTVHHAGFPMKAIHMVDHLKGWALTDQNILLTSDGGMNWKDVTPSGSAYGKYTYGDFMNDQYAWIVSTAQSLDNSVSVLRTSDGGQHWQSSTIALKAVSLLDSPHFLTTQEGFLELAIGGSGTANKYVSIFQTTDGGQNWTEVSNTSSFPPNSRKTGISFKDASNGWATGEGASATPWLYVTHDGGQSWSQQSLPDVSGALTTRTTPPVFFGNTGFLPATIVVNGAAQAVVMETYQTTDGGATWTLVKPEQPFGTNAAGFAPSDLCIADVNHAWGTDAIGQVWGTSDGFKHWNVFNRNPASVVNPWLPMHVLSFVDASFGWGLTDTSLLHTTDGGYHWSQITYHITA
jgi:photosystem II stability/assembly factor-like uncharacterized protein